MAWFDEIMRQQFIHISGMAVCGLTKSMNG
jgi:hypothetical protein